MNVFSKRENEPIRNTPTLQPPVISQRRSEAAAQAAQHVYELEQSLQETHDMLKDAEAAAALHQRRIDELEKQLIAVTEERDWHKQRHIQIETSLRNSAAIILDVLRTPMNGAPEAVSAASAEANERIKQAVAGIERDIIDVTANKPAEQT